MLSLGSLLFWTSLAVTPLPKLAVLGLNVEPGVGVAPAPLLDVLVTETAALHQYDVISKNEIESMLGLERLKDAAGCDEVSCMADVGGALGAEHLVSGSVARLGQGFVVSLQLVNVAHASVENRVSVTWEGPDAGLVRAVGLAAQDLLLERTQKLPGRVEVTQLPPGAMVFLDARPRTVPLERVEMGTHQLKVTAPDYEPKVVPFVLRSGEQLTLDGALARHVEPVSDARPVALSAQLEVWMLQDQMTVSGARPGPAPVLALEGTYRFSRWLRLGLRGYKLLANGKVIETSTPWASASSVSSGGGLGLVVASSVLFKPGRYDLSVDVGPDLHLEELTIVNYALPSTYSVAQSAPNRSGPRFGAHAGVSGELFLSSTFSLGLLVRYAYEAGYTITFNGQSMHRSLSSLMVGPRVTLLF